MAAQRPAFDLPDEPPRSVASSIAMLHSDSTLLMGYKDHPAERRDAGIQARELRRFRVLVRIACTAATLAAALAGFSLLVLWFHPGERNATPMALVAFAFSAWLPYFVATDARWRKWSANDEIRRLSRFNAGSSSWQEFNAPPPR